MAVKTKQGSGNTYTSGFLASDIPLYCTPQSSCEEIVEALRVEHLVAKYGKPDVRWLGLNPHTSSVLELVWNTQKKEEVMKEYPNPYIQANNLRTIDLLVPNYSDISLYSLAKSLSYLNRFTGHAGRYSVAQHSVHVMSVVRDLGEPVEVQAGALLHDLHEAVLGDVSTPVKRAFKSMGFDFKKLEAPHVKEVERKFNVETCLLAIKQADSAMCNAEADQCLGGRVGPDWPNVAPADLIIPQWTQAEALLHFMDESERLGIPG